MSARATFPVKFARLGIAVSLAVLLAAVGFRLISRRSHPVRAVSENAAPETRTIDRKEGIRHREYKDGKVWDDLRADRFFLGEDGLNHLEGSVEILDHGRAEGRETRISADRVAYNKEMLLFKISGRVKVTAEDLTFESDSIKYDKTAGLYRTDQGGAFTSDRLAGSGRTFVYDEKRNDIGLSGGFLFETSAGPPTSGAARITGDSLVYSRGEKTGRAEGRARLSSADGDGASEVLRFQLSDDGRTFDSMTFEKGAKCVFGGPAGRPGRRAIEAATVRVLSFPGSSRVSVVDAEGGCRMSLAAPPEPGGRIEAAALRLSLGRGGELESWTASGDVRMSMEGKTGDERDLQGESVTYSGKPGLLTVQAGEGGTARLESAESRTEAPAISLETGTGNAVASGGVRCLMKPRPDAAPVGFFSKDASLFVTCRSLKSFGDEHRLRFEGQVRLWQDNRAIQANELDVLESSGEVRARGGVTAGFPFRGRSPSEDSRIEIGGGEMAYSPADRIATFRGGSLVRTQDFQLVAGTVAVRLMEGKKEVQSLIAGGSVVVSHGLYEGRGGEAVYDPGAETVVLTGNPVLVEKGKGSSRGDKLTFRLGDDKILIENKGQGRSITVVKS
ncbi:MAG: LptA/OstA family protein [Candidatus Aminicenantales bacterium]|jgi:lipopolysaccharide export system protein LptA